MSSEMETMDRQILVVEDNPLNLELATDLLEARGFVVRPARTAKEGIRLAREFLPDLILMDVSLPGLDGLAATKALRAEAATRHLTVIALTAHAMKGDEARALEAGCKGYLAKPIDTRTFVDQVAAFIPSGKSRQTEPDTASPSPMQNEVLIPITPAAARVRPHRGLVLVVDDEPANRSLLRDPLEVHGYEILEADHGEQALQMIAQRPPDVILLDVMMPGMDGYEVCRRLKGDDRTLAIPILMVTALSERKERLMGIAAGANDFLTKPVDMVEVTLRVGHAARGKALFDQLQAERANVERLLLNTLPSPIAERMKRGEVNIADQHPDVSVLVADLVGFTVLTAHIGPHQVVCLLNEIFSGFDDLAGQHGLEKIKTMGDAYMVAGGVPLPRSDHAEAIVQMALDCQQQVERFNRSYNTSIHLRIGIGTGPVVAGVIGRRKFSYDLWGSTVNLACRLAALDHTAGILVSEATCERLKHKYRFENGRSIDVKGLAGEKVYDLCGRA